MRRPRAVAAAALAAACLGGSPIAAVGAAAPGVPASAPARPVSDEAVAAVAGRLRCVVCQNLSVQDSPSEMARQMRDLIRERLAQGDTPEQVLAYFEARYGEWVLLAPRLRGIGLLAWALPVAGLGVGIVVLVMVGRRWRRRGIDRSAEPLAPLDPADRDRVRREVERLGGDA